MPQIINTNISSLTAQRNLNTSQSALAVALQRLSSGLRINSAKDDAAGNAIADRMTTQIRGMNQAIRNANDGTSLGQTGEGALAELASNLQRIRELAVQSANATNSAGDRAALDSEVQQRLAEVDRVAAQTSFNGQKILDGSFGSATFQVGANVGETITVGLSTSMRTTVIGKTADYVNSTTQYSTSLAVGQQGTGVDTTAIGTGELTLAVGTGSAVGIGASVAGTGNGQSAGSAYAKAAAVSAAGVGGLTVDANTTVQFAWGDFASGGATDTYTLSVNTVAIYTATTAAVSGSAAATAISANASATGVTASYDSGTGVMTLTATDGRDIAVSQTKGAGGVNTEGLLALAGTNNANNVTTGSAATAGGATVAKTYVGTIHLTAADTITVGGTTPARIGYTAATMALGNSALNVASVTTVANANAAISRVDAALTAVNGLRATFGSIQNRFDSVIASLTATAENVTSARSRIQDADFAAETAALTRGQILQQAGVAVLAQANALPNNVLALLRG